MRRPPFTETTEAWQEGPPVASKILQRTFQMQTVNTIRLGDATCIRTRAGPLHLAVNSELASWRVDGWAISEDVESALVVAPQGAAVASWRPSRGLPYPIDHGSACASRSCRDGLKRIGAVTSTRRTGDRQDDAVAASAELLHHERYETRAHAKAGLQDHIEGFYNPRRRHSSTGSMSPRESELRVLSASRAA